MRLGIAADHAGFDQNQELLANLRAADHFSAREGVEDDDLKVICLGGLTTGSTVTWELVQTFTDVLAGTWPAWGSTCPSTSWLRRMR